MMGNQRARRESGRPDRGVATVWTATAIAGLVAVFSVVTLLAVATVSKHRAANAADLAALAAAGTAKTGTEPACAQAGKVATRMRATVRSCLLAGWDALVELDVDVHGLGVAHARARAGPVAAPPGVPASGASSGRPGTVSGP